MQPKEIDEFATLLSLGCSRSPSGPAFTWVALMGLAAFVVGLMLALRGL